VLEVEAAAPSAFVTVIEAKDRTGRVEDLGSLLRESAGIQVQSLGGLGSFSTVSIRGAASGQVNVFVDGVPVGGPGTGSVDLSTFPVEGIERIEVYRGFTPAFLSPSNIGGALNIVTKKAKSAAAEFKLSYGSFATRAGSAFGSFRGERLSLSGFAEYSGTDGTFEYKNGNGTPFNHADDRTEVRRNNVSNAFSGSFSAAYLIRPKWRVTIRDDPFHRVQGVPGTESVQSSTALFERTQNLAEARLDVGPFGGTHASVHASLSHLGRYDRFVDRNGEVGIGVNRVVRGADDAIALNVRTELAPLEWQVLSLGAGGRLEYFTPTDEIPVEREGGTSSRASWHLVAEDTLTFFSGVLTLTPNIRVEGASDSVEYDPSYITAKGSAFTPQASRTDTAVLPAFGVRVQPVSWLALKANASMRARQPAFHELFGDSGTVMGNPELRPETGESLDAGFALDPETLHFEYSFFQSQMNDLIQFMQNSQRTTMATNIGEAIIRGHEVSFAWAPDAPFRLTGSYTYQDAENRSPVPSQTGKQLPYRPRHSFFGRAEMPFEGLTPYFEYVFVSGNYFDPANMRPTPSGVPARRIQNAGVSWTSGEGTLTVSVEAKNLENQDIQDFAGYPLPGRSVFGAVTMKL
jgi:iron complex outermembrane receptor protein